MVPVHHEPQWATYLNFTYLVLLNHVVKCMDFSCDFIYLIIYKGVNVTWKQAISSNLFIKYLFTTMRKFYWK